MSKCHIQVIVASCWVILLGNFTDSPLQDSQSPSQDNVLSQTWLNQQLPSTCIKTNDCPFDNVCFRFVYERRKQGSMSLQHLQSLPLPQSYWGSSMTINVPIWIVGAKQLSRLCKCNCTRQNPISPIWSYRAKTCVHTSTGVHHDCRNFLHTELFSTTRA